VIGLFLEHSSLILWVVLLALNFGVWGVVMWLISGLFD
jgi:hypothetical protein